MAFPFSSLNTIILDPPLLALFRLLIRRTIGKQRYARPSFSGGPEIQMGEAAKDLAAGTIGGAAQLIIGHPFDTIKVKLQSQPAGKGAMDALRQTVGAQGVGGLFKGMGAPLATVAALNAVLFTTRGQMESLMSKEGGALDVNQQFVCGAAAGLAVGILACPTELIKCRLQAQTPTSNYGGPLDVARHVVSQAGLKGLCKGMVPTLAREVTGNAIMFGVYEAVKQGIAGGKDTSELGRGSLMLAGGIAGGSFWGLVYPTDIVKSIIQVDDLKKPKYVGSMDALRKLVAAEGVRSLYKGFTPAIGRSIFANSACFLVYEVTRSSLG